MQQENLVSGLLYIFTDYIQSCCLFSSVFDPIVHGDNVIVTCRSFFIIAPIVSSLFGNDLVEEERAGGFTHHTLTSIAGRICKKSYIL